MSSARTRFSRLWQPAATSAALGAALLAGALVGSPGHRAADLPEVTARFQLAQTASNSQGSFGIAGQGNGLFPGGTQQLAMQFDNPNPFPIDVSRVEAASVRTDNAGCASGMFGFGSLASAVRVPANGTATAAMRITLAEAAPDACQGVTVTLSFSGNAVPSDGFDPTATTLSPVTTAGRTQVLGDVATRPPTPMARTGADALRIAGTGLLALAVGLVAVAATRRPRSA